MFTAAYQKHAFGVRKANISQQRALFRVCHAERCRLDLEARACRRRWVAERPLLRHDSEFLRRWLAVLEARAGYDYRFDRANIAMLRRLTSE